MHVRVKKLINDENQKMFSCHFSQVVIASSMILWILFSLAHSVYWAIWSVCTTFTEMVNLPALETPV